MKKAYNTTSILVLLFIIFNPKLGISQYDTAELVMAVPPPPWPTLDIIDTALEPFITDNDTVNKTLYTRQGFEIQVFKPRRVSRKRGHKIIAGNETFYLYIIRYKDMNVNGYPVQPQQLTTYREVEIRTNRAAARSDSLTPDTANVKTRRGFLRNIFKKKAIRTSRREATDTAQVNSSPATVSGSPQETGSNRRQLRNLNRKTSKSRTGRAGRETAQDSLGLLDPQQVGLQPQTPTERQVRIESSEEDMYAYMAVVSPKKRIGIMPDMFWSRTLFIKGIVDRTDSINQFFDTFIELKQIYDSLKSDMASIAQPTMAQKGILEQYRIETIQAFQRFQLYYDLKKYKGRKRKIIKKFFLGPHFYSTNLAFNIMPMPYALPQIHYITKPRGRTPEAQPEPEQQIAYRFGVTRENRERIKFKKAQKFKFTDDVLTEAPTVDSSEIILNKVEPLATATRQHTIEWPEGYFQIDSIRRASPRPTVAPATRPRNNVSTRNDNNNTNVVPRNLPDSQSDDLEIDYHEFIEEDNTDIETTTPTESENYDDNLEDVETFDEFEDDSNFEEFNDIESLDESMDEFDDMGDIDLEDFDEDSNTNINNNNRRN